jgi:hypothetical protein
MAYYNTKPIKLFYTHLLPCNKRALKHWKWKGLLSWYLPLAAGAAAAPTTVSAVVAPAVS